MRMASDKSSICSTAPLRSCAKVGFSTCWKGGYDLNAFSEAVVTTFSTTLRKREFKIQEEQTEEYSVYRKQMNRMLLAYWDIAG